MANTVRTTRFSGADWADQLHKIMLVGVGGIGSWLTLNLARIGHELYIIDNDDVDETNVHGGQMYKETHIGQKKAHAVQSLCREMGTSTKIVALPQLYEASLGTTDIMITGLDNMAARKLVYEAWKAHVLSKETDEERAKCLFMDGRLTMEMFEVLTIQGNNVAQMEHYEREFLFDDAQTQELDCTTKQSTFAAMGISCNMTRTLCNWLTNQKLGFDMREVPLYQRDFFPICEYRKLEAGQENTSQQVVATVIGAATEAAPAAVAEEATIETAPPKEPSESVHRLKAILA